MLSTSEGLGWERVVSLVTKNRGEWSEEAQRATETMSGPVLEGTVKVGGLGRLLELKPTVVSKESFC